MHSNSKQKLSNISPHLKQVLGTIFFQSLKNKMLRKSKHGRVAVTCLITKKTPSSCLHSQSRELREDVTKI